MCQFVVPDELSDLVPLFLGYDLNFGEILIPVVFVVLLAKCTVTWFTAIVSLNVFFAPREFLFWLLYFTYYTLNQLAGHVGIKPTPARLEFAMLSLHQWPSLKASGALMSCHRYCMCSFLMVFRYDTLNLPSCQEVFVKWKYHGKMYRSSRGILYGIWLAFSP